MRFVILVLAIIAIVAGRNGISDQKYNNTVSSGTASCNAYGAYYPRVSGGSQVNQDTESFVCSAKIYKLADNNRRMGYVLLIGGTIAAICTLPLILGDSSKKGGTHAINKA